MKPHAYLAFVLLLIGPGGLVGKGSAAEPIPDTTGTEPLIRTHGVKINVDDMARALAFYGDKLGFEVEDRRGYPQYVVLKSGVREKLILNRVKTLRAPSPAETRVTLTLQVNDLDRSIERFKALGVELDEKGKRKEGVGYAIFIKDPFGRLISLMHQTIVKVEPFREPKIYNFGFSIPDMQAGRDFYSDKLGFDVLSEKYLPLDLPLRHKDRSFAFMLHYRTGVLPVKGDHARAAAFNTLVFETRDLLAAVKEMKSHGITILSSEPLQGPWGRYVVFEDPFGNVSELLEYRRQ
jgi:lactoylglutathione lyase